MEMPARLMQAEARDDGYFGTLMICNVGLDFGDIRTIEQMCSSG